MLSITPVPASGSAGVELGTAQSQLVVLFLAFFLTSTVLMIHTHYLYQNGVEFQRKVIGAIVNLPTPTQSSEISFFLISGKRARLQSKV